MAASICTGASAQITPFSFESHAVRIVLRDGEPWFALTDVCTALDIENHRNVRARLDDDERGVQSMDTPGGKQTLSIINESGLYSVILTSRKPEAKRFKKWVTSEVLPAIRKTGKYEQPQVPALPATLPPADVLSILGLASTMGTVVQQTIFKSVLAEGDDWKNGRWVMEFIKDSKWAAPPIFRRLNDDEHITTAADIASALIAGEFSRPDLLAIANASAQRLYVQACTDGPKGIGAQVRQLINRDLSQTDLREIVTSATLELWMRAMPEKSA